MNSVFHVSFCHIDSVFSFLTFPFVLQCLAKIQVYYKVFLRGNKLYISCRYHTDYYWIYIICPYSDGQLYKGSVCIFFHFYKQKIVCFGVSHVKKNDNNSRNFRSWTFYHWQNLVRVKHYGGGGRKVMNCSVINQQAFITIIICLILQVVLQWRQHLSCASIPEGNFNLVISLIPGQLK